MRRPTPTFPLRLAELTEPFGASDQASDQMHTDNDHDRIDNVE